jgi:hypothetical protein
MRRLFRDDGDVQSLFWARFPAAVQHCSIKAFWQRHNAAFTPASGGDTSNIVWGL